MKKHIHLSLTLLIFGSIAAHADPFYVTTGAGNILDFTAPNTSSVFASGLNSPNGLAMDIFGNLYEANSGTNQIFKFTAPNTYTVYASGLNGNLRLECDSVGNLYEADVVSGRILKFTAPNTYSVFASGLNYASSLAIDQNNNVYVSERFTGQILKFTAPNVSTVYASGLTLPTGIAVDADNRVYVAENTSSGTVRQFTAPNTSTVYASGLNNPNGLALDSTGNLFVAEVSTIKKYTAPNTSTTYASGLFYPNSFAFAGSNSLVPTPTAAPSISVFPAADQNFYGGMLQTLQNHGSEFSPSTQAFLSTTTTQLQPLINPSSDTALKKTASLLAFGAKTFGDGLDLASNFTDPGGFFLSGNITGSLPNAISDVTKMWGLESFAFGLAGVQAPTTNFAPLDIVNGRIGEITTLTSSAYAFSHGNVLSGLLSLNAFIYRDMLAPQLEQFTHDPADPNFQTVYLPDMLHLSSLPSTGNAPLDEALSREMQGLANAAQYLKAVNASFDKYAGAIAAGDNLHAALQMEAVLHYLALYNQASQDASAAVTDTQNLIAALGFVGSYDPQKLIAFQSQLAASGFSADVLAYYTGIGYTAADINNLKQDILNLNANSFSANMANVDAQTSANLLQGTTAAVPEPSTMAMLGIGLFSLGFRRRRSSAAREAGLNPS